MARIFNAQSLKESIASLENRVKLREAQHAEIECTLLIQDLRQASNAVMPSPSLRQQGVKPTWLPGAELWGEMLKIITDAHHELRNGNFASASEFLRQARAVFEASQYFPK